MIVTGVVFRANGMTVTFDNGDVGEATWVITESGNQLIGLNEKQKEALIIYIRTNNWDDGLDPRMKNAEGAIVGGLEEIINSHITNTNNPHHTTAASVGADPIGSAAAVQTNLTNHTTDVTIHFTEGSIDHNSIQNVGVNSHSQIDDHIASNTNPHSVTLEQVRTVNNSINGVIDLNNNFIINTPTPTQQHHVVNKGYVDAFATGLKVLDPARVATIANLSATYSVDFKTLTANSNGAISIDGVALILNDRVLVKNQTNKNENGVFKVTQVGDGSNPYILTLVDDFNEQSEVKNGTFILITAGTNASSGWVVTSLDPITLGVDDIIWSQFSSPTTIVAGDALDQDGGTLNVNVDNSTIEVSSDALQVKDGGITNAKLDKANIPLSGFGAATANIDLGGYEITNVAISADSNSVATQGYVTGTIVNKNSNYTANYGEIVLVDTSIQAVTITLPAVSSDKRSIIIKKISTDGRYVTIDGNGGELIDGELIQIIDGFNDCAELKTDGISWYVI